MGINITEETLRITGHNFDVTPALRTFTVEKFQKLQRHSDHITSLSVTFNVEKLNHIAEANIHVRGSDIHASAESTDMYSAVDLLIDKLDRQVIKHKEIMTDHSVDTDH